MNWQRMASDMFIAAVALGTVYALFELAKALI